MSGRARRPFHAGFLIVAAGACGSAWAQGIDSAPERIVVTAEFRPSTVQDTPLSITAISGAMMEARGQTGIAQLGDIAPNVTLRPTGPAQGGSALVAYIRGVGQTDFSIALEPGVGVYVDDVYFPTLSGALVELVDLERAEILRGPQGTLAGKNSIGGALKLYSIRPEGAGDSALSVTYGGYDRFGLRGIADVTLVPGRLFARVSGMARAVDGYVRQYDYECLHPGSGLPQLTTGADCLLGREGGERVAALRGSVRWAVTPDFDLTLIADTTQEDSEARANVLVRAQGTGLPFSPSPVGVYADVNGNRAFDPGIDIPHDCRFVPSGPESCDANPQGRFANYANFYDPAPTPALLASQDPFKPWLAPQVTRLNDRGLSLNAEWRLNDALTLSSITAWRRYRSEFSEDIDASPIALQQEVQVVRHRQWSQELRLSGVAADGALDWTVGGFWFDQENVFTSRVDIPYVAMDIKAGPDVAPSVSKAVFATATWRPAARLGLTAGLRYSDETKSYSFRRSNQDDSPIAGPCAAYPGHPLNPANCGVFGLDGLVAGFTHDRIDYRLVADYRWTDRLMTYAQLSTGYKGGGVNPRPFTPDQLNSFRPETLTAYEAGMKSVWLDGALTVNAAAFYNDYVDIQMNYTLCPDSVLPTPCMAPRNAGDARVIGWEAEAQWRATRALRFDASLGVLDFDFTRIDPNADGSLDAVPPFTPELTWSAGAQYEFDLGDLGLLTPRLDASYRSGVYAGAQNTPTNRIDGYVLANARLGWRAAGGDWRAALEVSNLTNEYYFLALYDASAATGFTSGMPARPRTWSLTLTRQF